MLAGSMMDTGDRESGMQNEEDLSHVSDFSPAIVVVQEITNPSEYSEVIVGAKCLLYMSSAVHAQCDRDSRKDKEQQVNRKDLYAAFCRFQSHSGSPLNQSSCMQVSSVSALYAAGKRQQHRSKQYELPLLRSALIKGPIDPGCYEDPFFQPSRQLHHSSRSRLL